MAELALDTSQRPDQQSGREDSQNAPQAEAAIDVETMAGQARALHDQVFERENGIPSAASFEGVQQFVNTLRYDPDEWFVHNGQTIRGAYFTSDGERLDPGVAQDLIYTAAPENWVQNSSNRDVLARARDALRSDADLEPEAAGMLQAEALAGRVAEHADRIDDQALQRLLDMDQLARKKLEKTRGGQAIIEQEALRNEREASLFNRPDIALGYAQQPGSRGAHNVMHLGRGADRIVVHGDEIGAQPTRLASRKARVSTEYPEELNLDSESDVEILSRLLAKDDVISTEDVAAFLYPKKIVGGQNVYGAISRGRILRFGEQSEYRSLDSLTEAERAEVDGFARAVAAARHHEGEVAERFRRRLPLPTYEQLAYSLFPAARQPEGRVKLRDDQWAVVRQEMARLRAIHDEQVRVERLVGLRMRWAAIKDDVQNLRARAARARQAFPESLGSFRASMGEAAQNARDAAATAKESLTPEQIKLRASAMLGATALAAGNLLQNKPWQNIIPATKEGAVKLAAKIAAGASRIETSKIALALAVKLQTTAIEARDRLQAYIAGRLEEWRAKDQLERNTIIATRVALAAGIAAMAIHTYLQVRHSLDAQSHGSSTNLDSVTDIGFGENKPNPPSDDQTSKLEQIKNLLSGDEHPEVEIGSYDSGVKIMGYPKGTVGYRVLEYAQSTGVKVDSQRDAGRLIDATLRMDGLGWNEGVDSNQQIQLLSVNKMKSILGQ